MANFGRLALLLPLVFSIVGAVLASLALLAGHKRGFMEDYAVVRLNTSMIGHGAFSGDKDKNADSSDDGGGLFDKVTDKVKDKIGDLTASITDSVADKIGIADWYSVHILDACWGEYAPNATLAGASFNTTNCTQPSVSTRLNLTSILDKQLKVGPLELDLAEIGWPDKIQDTINVLNSALYALGVIYAITTALCILSALLCLPSLIKPDKTSLIKTNLILATAAALFTTVASIVVIVASYKGVNELNDVGERVGLVAVKGTKFYSISFVTMGLMIVTAAFWIGRHLAVKKEVKDAMHEKSQLA